MRAVAFVKAGEWFVRITHEAHEETAGPFDDEHDAEMAARRVTQ